MPSWPKTAATPANTGKDYLSLEASREREVRLLQLSLDARAVDVLKKIHDVVRNSKGEYVTVGLVPSAELADRGKSLLKGFTADWIYLMALGAAYRVAHVNFDADLQKVEDLFARDCNALPNLEKFGKLGHKLLIIQGKLDTVVPAQYVREYYDTVASRNGGIEKTRRRVFFVPGMWHGNMTDCNPLSTCETGLKGVAESLDLGVRYKTKTYSRKWTFIDQAPRPAHGMLRPPGAHLAFLHLRAFVPL